MQAAQEGSKETYPAAVTTKMKDRTVIDSPYALRAKRAAVVSDSVRFELDGGVVVAIPVKALGFPWTQANAKKLANVHLRFGGTWLWWDDLDEGLVLDELFASTIRLNPAAMLARRARGRRASPAKAAAARSNGAKGGRPKHRRAPTH